MELHGVPDAPLCLQPLVDGGDLNPWAKALYGREIPKGRDRWEVIPKYPEYLERLK